jgi:hypothetical protein
VGDAFVAEDAQDVRERVHDAEARQKGGVAERLLGNGRRIDVLDDGVGDLGRAEDLSQRFNAGVRNLGYADPGGHGANARCLMHAGENREQGCLAHHGQADDCSFHFRGGRPPG